MSVIARVLLALLLAPAIALAQPVTIEWDLQLETCGGATLTREDIQQIEIYVSAAPIPASDVPCPAAGQPVDSPPDSFSTRVEATSVEDSVTVDLIPATYHVRMRVRTADGWSNLSNEVVKEIPLGPLKAPVIISIG